LVNVIICVLLFVREELHQVHERAIGVGGAEIALDEKDGGHKPEGVRKVEAGHSAHLHYHHNSVELGASIDVCDTGLVHETDDPAHEEGTDHKANLGVLHALKVEFLHEIVERLGGFPVNSVFDIFFAELFRFAASPDTPLVALEVRHLFIEGDSVHKPVVGQHADHEKAEVPELEATSAYI